MQIGPFSSSFVEFETRDLKYRYSKVEPRFGVTMAVWESTPHKGTRDPLGSVFLSMVSA